MWIKRDLENAFLGLLATRPAVVLTGARQVGKSSMLRQLLPDAGYISLDRPAIAAEAETSPEQFLRRWSEAPVIIDEIQYAPSIFRELKVIIDQDRSALGRFILTGSQHFPLMANVSESLAGRVSWIYTRSLVTN
jgi:uncharacterized protein